MKTFKKILKIIFIVLLVLVGLLFATPYLFKGKIVKLVKAEINKNLNAQVDFKKVNISFFRNFPRVSIGLDELHAIGTGYFSEDTLLYANRLDATVDIMSFIRGKNMSVYNVDLKSPRFHAVVTEEGYANWDIVKQDVEKLDSLSETKPFNLQLKAYSIENGFVNYEDRQAGMSALVYNVDHTGNGDFTSDLFTLKTKTTADSVNFVYGAVPFLSNVKTTVTADVLIDNKNEKYSFNGLDILLNALQINGDGSIQTLPNGYALDINFKSPSTDFKNILSLIPAIYKSDFDKVTTSGTANFEGFIKGIYADSTMPGYRVAMEVKDASFKYTDLPKAIQQINFKGVIDNPDGQTDNVVVDITNGHLQMDNEPFDFRVLVKNPVSNMYIDGAAKGKLNLSQVASYVKLENGTSISGLMNADVSVKGNVNDIEKQRYENFYAAGTIDVNNFNYTSVDYPTGIKVHQVTTRFTPTKVDVSNFSGQYQNSNFSGGGQINNLLSYLLNGKALNANLNLNADKINLNDWLGVSADTTAKGPAAAPFAVPANLDITLNTIVNNLKYDQVDIQNLSGVLQVKDEGVQLTNIKGNAMDGTILINGSYSTKESKVKPAIALSYNVSQVDIQKTFYAFNTAEKLMPIGKFLSGTLTSVLTAKGRLGDNMNLDIGTISGNGNLFLIEGFLSRFAPLEKIASTLQIKALEQISLKDVKAFFEFSNGKMLVKPFTVKIKDIEMEIGGLQGLGFDQAINYAINLKLPRALIGTKGTQFIDNLVTSVNAKGIPFKLSETVNLKLAMTGTIRNPALQVDLKQTGETLADQMKEQVKDFVQAKIDSAKNAVKDTLASIRKQLQVAAQEELRRKLFGLKDSTVVKDSTSTPVKKPVDKSKESLKGLLELFKKKQKDSMVLQKDTVVSQ